MRPKLEGLTDRHVLSRFSCGEPSLDNWLRSEAMAAQRTGSSRTHVWTWEGSSEVVGYFSWRPHMMPPGDLSKKLLGGISGAVPGFLLAKLALHQDLRYRTPPLGPDLLLDALATCLTAADAVGGRLIVVDTVNDRARRFYERQEFRSLPSSDRLYMKVSTVRELLSEIEAPADRAG